MSELAFSSVAEYGWSKADLGVGRADLIALAKAVIDGATKAKRDLPLSPESQFIQEAIDERFKAPGPAKAKGNEASASSAADEVVERFVPFSFDVIASNRPS